METRRSDSALRRRAVTASASRRADSVSTRPITCRSLIASKASWSAASSSSTASRSSRDRQAVSRAITVARHSVTRPARQAAQVWGSSCRTTLASPRWRCPRCGDSRRAWATIDATPCPRRAAGTPSPSWSASTDSARSAACAACAAVAVQTSSSSARIRSTRSVSSSPLGPSSATCTSRRIAATAAAVSGGWEVVMDPLNTKGPTVGSELVDDPPLDRRTKSVPIGTRAAQRAGSRNTLLAAGSVVLVPG